MDVPCINTPAFQMSYQTSLRTAKLTLRNQTIALPTKGGLSGRQIFEPEYATPSTYNGRKKALIPPSVAKAIKHKSSIRNTK